MRGLLTLIVAALVACPVAACPLCESPAGRRVRAGVFDGDFAANLLAVASPFLTLLAVAAIMHFGWPWPRGTARPAGSEGA